MSHLSPLHQINRGRFFYFEISHNHALDTLSADKS